MDDNSFCRSYLDRSLIKFKPFYLTNISSEILVQHLNQTKSLLFKFNMFLLLSIQINKMKFPIIHAIKIFYSVWDNVKQKVSLYSLTLTFSLTVVILSTYSQNFCMKMLLFQSAEILNQFLDPNFPFIVCFCYCTCQFASSQFRHVNIFFEGSIFSGTTTTIKLSYAILAWDPEEAPIWQIRFLI